MEILDKQYIEEQLKHLQRDINCIIDQDRNLRKQGLSKVLEFLKNKENQKEKLYLLDSYILKNLLRGFEDQVEKHREITIQIVNNFLQLHTKDCNFDTMKLLIETIINRLNQQPFPEQSEEIRLQLIQLLENIHKQFTESFRESLPKLAHMISKALFDNFPEVKKETAILASNIANSHPIGEYMADAVKAMVINMQHPHAKVRKSTIESLASIILSRKNGSFLEFAMKNIQILSLDKSSEVRKSTIICTSELLMHFSVQNLNTYENALLLILINGLSDDSKDIQILTLELLEQVGQKRQKLDEEANLVV